MLSFTPFTISLVTGPPAPLSRGQEMCLDNVDNNHVTTISGVSVVWFCDHSHQ